MRVQLSRTCTFMLVTVTLAGCTQRQLGLRVQQSSHSPNGSYEALVRNDPNVDPPRQSLWLGDALGPMTLLQHLSEHQDCHTILWSSDNSTVGFLVEDARLLVYDTASHKLIGAMWLVSEDGHPTTREARDLSLGENGTSVTFRACRRQSNDCGEAQRITFSR